MNEDKATRYHRLRRQAEVLAAGSAAAALVGLGVSPASRWLRDVASRLAAVLPLSPEAGPWVVVAAYVTVLWALLEVVELPFAFYRGVVLEQRYGLAVAGARSWLADHLRSALLGLAAGMVVAQAAYAALRWTAAWWWVPTWGLLVGGAVLLTWAAPLVLLPLFYRFERIEGGELARRLLALAERAGVPAVGVFEWKLGEKSRTANAALVGFGSTRRLLVSDTLVRDYTDDEIEVVLAHELAHHVHRDLASMLVVDAGLTLAGLLAGHLFLQALGPGLGLEPSDPAGMPLLLLAAALVGLVGRPLAYALSRQHERRADRYALDITRNPAAFVSAMRRLGVQNLADEQPSRPVEWFFYSHPPLRERIAAAERHLSKLSAR